MAAITAAELRLKLSTKVGSVGNSNSQADPNASLGKYVSTTELSGTALNNLFDNVSGSENAALTTEYRCVFVHNSNTSNALENAVVYLSGGDPAGGTTVTLAVDPTPASPLGSSSAQALEAASTDAPGSAVTSLSYLATSSAGTGVTLGSIPPGYVRAFWVRRAATASAAMSPETVTFAVSGSTGSL